jgi:hypothetical protein
MTADEKATDAEFLRRWIADAWRRTVMHHAFWFREVEDLLGLETACRLEAQVLERSLSIQLPRYESTLSPDRVAGSWPRLRTLGVAELDAVLDAAAKNWLVNDGVWFQAVEHHASLELAMRCNEGAWSRFAPYEAWRIQALLGIDGRSGGLEALKTALDYRLYARINTQDVRDDGDDAFVFRMLECRVQSARQRKGLEDYPCKSAGIIEFTGFARAIHPDVETVCLACPPDDHPREFACGWRFSLTRR